MMGGSATTYLWVCFQLSSHYFRRLYSLQFIYSLSVKVTRFEFWAGYVFKLKYNDEYGNTGCGVFNRESGKEIIEF